MSVTMYLDMSGVDAVLAEIGQGIESATRPAAQAAAQVIYEDVLNNVSRINSVTGNLRQSIYQAYSKDQSGPGKATYHISWRKRRFKDENGNTDRSGSIAPHGHLIEFGYVQRYEVYVNKKGEFKTKIRPGMKGKKKPGRRASQAVKDAYYVPRKGGPVQVMARPFLRPAAQKQPEAIQAAKLRLLQELEKVGVVR